MFPSGSQEVSFGRVDSRAQPRENRLIIGLPRLKPEVHVAKVGVRILEFVEVVDLFEIRVGFHNVVGGNQPRLSAQCGKGVPIKEQWFSLPRHATNFEGASVATDIRFDVVEIADFVSPTPGTTMDSVDTEVTREGRLYRFVDTAGIRRKGKTNLVAEKLSVVMARRGLERADVALLIVDAEQGVTQGDAQIASYAEESGRSVIIVMNKWDLAAEAARKAAERDAATTKGKAKRTARDTRPVNTNRSKVTPPLNEMDKGRLLFDYEKMVRGKLKFLSYAPIVFLSAKTGDRANKLYPLIDMVAAARKRRIPTPELNRWLKEEVDLQRGTTPKARPVRIYYITQAKTAPPTFLIFTNQKEPLHFSYERFLENQLRAKFAFVGAPVRFVQRLRKRGDKSTGDQ